MPSWDLPASCPTNGHLSLPNGKRYVAPSDEQVDYATAQARCAAEGGTVALPLDTNEQAYLVFFKNCLNQNAQFWLGLSRPVGTWVDSQGSALGGFSAWAPGEPDERTKLCSRLVFGAQSNSERRNKWADAPCGESFRYICKTNGWLTGNTSWIVDASGNDATRALDGDAGSFWNPPGPPGISQDWYMVLDLGQPYNLTRLAVNSYGDTTHDVAAFKLQKAQVWIPYTWEDVATVRYVQGGTNQRQEFGGFQGTARYWKFTIMRTHSIYQPWFGELNLYGTPSLATGSMYDHADVQACEYVRTTGDTKLYQWDLPLPKSSPLTFRTNASNDVFIALSLEPSDQVDMYEILIGGRYNVGSVIRRTPEGPNEVNVSTPDNPQWLDVFYTMKGTGQTVYDAWSTIGQVTHYKCPVVDQWESLTIQRVSLW
ncbi:uncharacterized protein LOC144903813 [Branchiostoma floridae x Branchiostoma belcheri]